MADEATARGGGVVGFLIVAALIGVIGYAIVSSWAENRREPKAVTTCADFFAAWSEQHDTDRSVGSDFDLVDNDDVFAHCTSLDEIDTTAASADTPVFPEQTPPVLRDDMDLHAWIGGRCQQPANATSPLCGDVRRDQAVAAIEVLAQAWGDLGDVTADSVVAAADLDATLNARSACRRDDVDWCRVGPPTLDLVPMVDPEWFSEPVAGAANDALSAMFGVGYDIDLCTSVWTGDVYDDGPSDDTERLSGERVRGCVDTALAARPDIEPVVRAGIDALNTIAQPPSGDLAARVAPL